MGVSTDGQICFGIALDDDEATKFPWDTDEHDGDIEHWWLYEEGYENPFELYDAYGNYLNRAVPPDSKVKE